MARLQKDEYNHVEAFALMHYQCKSCQHRIRVWNSRDGVTPFGIACLNCGEDMLHIAWAYDVRKVNYIPEPGGPVFIDLPDELKPVIARIRIEASRGTEFYPEDAIAYTKLLQGLIDGFQEGEPFLIRWPK